jgi:hypothetical protein
MRETVFIDDIYAFGILDDPPAWRAERPDRAQVELCRRFLSQHAVKSTKWSIGTSYGFKHEVERWNLDTSGRFKSIANGAFILAALEMGFEAKRDVRRSPNARFKLKLVRESR